MNIAETYVKRLAGTVVTSNEHEVWDEAEDAAIQKYEKLVPVENNLSQVITFTFFLYEDGSVLLARTRPYERTTDLASAEVFAYMEFRLYTKAEWEAMQNAVIAFKTGVYPE